MTKGRLEAFSDGVIAILITIMMLELKVPHDATLASLVPVVPILCSYLVSFVFVGMVLFGLGAWLAASRGRCAATS